MDRGLKYLLVLSGIVCKTFFYWPEAQSPTNYEDNQSKIINLLQSKKDLCELTYPYKSMQQDATKIKNEFFIEDLWEEKH